MSEKLQMKLVIDEVTTPLLYARLLAARSPRERAALLRSLAEAGLRDVLNGASRRATPVAGNFDVTVDRRSDLESASLVGSQPQASEGQIRAVSTVSDHVHDTDALADQFEPFF